ncbi:MAG: hypothetical protein AABZ47_15020 [Planctomycetota bacterium]
MAANPAMKSALWIANALIPVAASVMPFASGPTVGRDEEVMPAPSFRATRVGVGVADRDVFLPRVGDDLDADAPTDEVLAVLGIPRSIPASAGLAPDRSEYRLVPS